ncbi:hypothetical protein EDB81DRAFT_799332 [Dactylonectria macrodidyma]|uniref:Uncharacterized protein n=1 Tax=Dactylonectria macrodidyma TaxID=307937 RepID=A0A9P9J4M4_9HYPO|nr:hypothetical protein EDB81DRAFT_799332 [Dactylonectria macrodidyma]
MSATQVEAKHRYFESYDRIVRCSEGHLYTTVWVPMMSVKAIRLGNRRVQHCPVGSHWSTVVRVQSDELTQEELEKATETTDSLWP